RRAHFPRGAQGARRRAGRRADRLLSDEPRKKVPDSASPENWCLTPISRKRVSDTNFSVCALQDEVAEPHEAFAALAERRERAHRARVDLVRTLPRAVEAEDRRVGRLVVRAVAARALAERRRILLDLEEIVADLEHEADVAREDVEPAALGVGELAELARHHDRRADQLAGLAT